MHLSQLACLLAITTCLLSLGVDAVVLKGGANLASLKEPGLETRDASSSRRATLSSNAVYIASNYDASSSSLADHDGTAAESREERLFGHETLKRYATIAFDFLPSFNPFSGIIPLTTFFGTSVIVFRQSQSMTLDLNDTWTNESLEEYLCWTINWSYGSLTINGNGTYLKVPSCLPVNGTSLQSIKINEMVVESFLAFTTISTLTLQRCRFSPVATAPDDGFNPDGTVNWNEVWAAIRPNLLEVSNGNLRGSIPSTLGDYVRTLRLQGNQLSGTLPPSLFTSIQDSTAYEFNFGNNQLTGSIPANFFAYPSGFSMLQGFYVYLNDNRLSGTLPPSLLLPFEQQYLVLFTLDLSGNMLSGSIPTQLIAREIVESYTSFFTLSLARNGLEGSIPPTLFANLTGMAAFNFDASSNKLSGTLPTNLFPNGMTLTSNNGAMSLKLDLANNSLTGSIPNGLLALSSLANGPSPVWLSVSDNQLSGTIPSSLFNDFDSASLMLTAARNQLNGTLPTFLTGGNVFSLDVANNKLEGSIPNDWQSQNPRDINLSNNAAINGTFPLSLFTGTGITSFAAKHTSLTGILPAIGISLGVFDLAYTNIDFCNANSSPISNFAGTTCDLSNSTACTCQLTFVPCIALCPCSVTTKPSSSSSSSAQCVNGAWSTASTLVISAGSGVVTITGNLTSSSVRFSDAISSINVTGCANNLAEVSVELNDTAAREIGGSSIIGGSRVLRDLVTVAEADENGTPCMDLSLVAVKASTTGTCRKVKSEKEAAQNNGKTLAAYFTVSSTSCNLWWIILSAALGGAVIIAVIIVIVCVTCCKCCKLKVRPYAASEGVFRTG